EVPIVASAIGQVTEILTHRRTALLHPAGSIAKLVEHVDELRVHPRLAARLARAARHLAVKQYTWPRNAARVLAMSDTLHRQLRRHGQRDHLVRAPPRDRPRGRPLLLLPELPDRGCRAAPHLRRSPALLRPSPAALALRAQRAPRRRPRAAGDGRHQHAARD